MHSPEIRDCTLSLPHKTEVMTILKTSPKLKRDKIYLIPLSLYIPKTTMFKNQRPGLRSSAALSAAFGGRQSTLPKCFPPTISPPHLSPLTHVYTPSEMAQETRQEGWYECILWGVANFSSIHLINF